MFAQAGLLATPRAGEGALSNEETFLLKKSIAKSSGAFAFLFLQMHSAVGMLSKSPNLKLRERVLSQATKGEKLFGIGFGYLRRKGNIPLTATTKVGGGVRIEGSIPWATGRGYFDELLVGAEREDGRHVLFFLPFQGNQNISLSDDLPLAAMQVTGTCMIRCQNLEIAEDEIVDCLPSDWLERRDFSKLVEGCSYPLGCIERACESLEWSLRNEVDGVGNALVSTLRREYQTLLERCLSELESQIERREIYREIRGQVHELSVRAALAAVAAGGGAANTMQHDGQRVYREALAWTVLSQTKEIKLATLQALLSKTG